MSEPLGMAVICPQCEDVAFLRPGSEQQMSDQLASMGWEPYGTGVTPFAQENAARGMFSCPRCTNELLDERLKRIAGDVMKDLDVGFGWLVIRSPESEHDYLRILKPDGSVQVEFGHARTDREMRAALRESVAAALGLRG